MILVIVAVTIFEAQGLNSALTVDEVNRFSGILQSHKPDSLEDVYHVVKALKALGKEVPSVEVSYLIYFRQKEFLFSLGLFNQEKGDGASIGHKSN